jgi:hypothetical protein
MRMAEKLISCPICGVAARLTLVERIDQQSGAEGHRIEFVCTNREHALTEVELLRLWAADHATAS